MTLAKIGVTLSVLGLSMAAWTPAADARSRAPAASAVRANVHAMKAGMVRHGGRVYVGRGGISCVPFARENSGIELSGNAGQWWWNAEGVYQRGARPEVGSVLNFRTNGRMRMGHVAVVTQVVDGRNIEIDHANWSGPGATRGGVSRDITVVDVSERNDWTAVRVALGHTKDFGSVYPTYGFIYDRPDKGTMVANSGSAPLPLLNAAPRDLRPASERLASMDMDEVAEAADDAQPRRAYAGRHARTAAKAGPAHRVAGLSRPAAAKGAVVKVKSAAPHKHGRTHRM